MQRWHLTKAVDRQLIEVKQADGVERDSERGGDREGTLFRRLKQEGRGRQAGGQTSAAALFYSPATG